MSAEDRLLYKLVQRLINDAKLVSYLLPDNMSVNSLRGASVALRHSRISKSCQLGKNSSELAQNSSYCLLTSLNAG